MNRQPAITVSHLSKVFKIYSRSRDMFMELFSSTPLHREFEALRDISFTVDRGEVLGIMGRNGAGKSTLLRILAGTLNATGGEVRVRGRVAALLELGTGFNPQYTGRENIVTGGLCLGMDKAEIQAKTGEIIAFSELEKFIDQPFRTYSSGMQARLAFATALSVDPDIFIVDEALSVGDARFQRKCFAKMQALRESGKTILFVTHAEGAVSQFCDRALLLHEGALLLDGAPAEVNALYNVVLYGDREPGREETGSAPPGENDAPAFSFGKKTKAEILEVALLDEQGAPLRSPVSGQKCRLRSVVLCHEDMQEWGYGFTIRTIRGVMVFGSHSHNCGVRLEPLRAGMRIDAEMECTLHLAHGDFFVSAFVIECGKEAVTQDMRQDALHFSLPVRNDVYHQACVDLHASFHCARPADKEAPDTPLKPSKGWKNADDMRA